MYFDKAALKFIKHPELCVGGKFSMHCSELQKLNKLFAAIKILDYGK